MNNSAKLPARLRFSKKLTLYSLLSLVVLYTATGLLAAPVNWTTLVVPCLTLLIFVPGILLHQARNFDWLCFVILLHFTVGVTNSMSPSSAWHDYVQTLLSVLVFVGAMMTSRWLKRWQAAHAHGLDHSSP
ncbi:MAG: DUF2069 domain-containing protein [Gammaproteobacteria bacterium]|uniref:DUF2069 domain-containing protein n=1 Tax=Pseudomaricurvus alcaniphilus TaxID=1166482 RepID=UPI00140C65E4|nr:DUF2069 domain-containing protein [Pseudomaricurvus alcaniphilus]MBR9908886.1 DUF2069 domain-containing protein [Gammaproteobacteria bacterium]NHN37939.1 DUF2069 domain-containing protein [Pseudomaricurvus alcaniphilus]